MKKKKKELAVTLMSALAKIIFLKRNHSRTFYCSKAKQERPNCKNWSTAVFPWISTTLPWCYSMKYNYSVFNKLLPPQQRYCHYKNDYFFPLLRL